MKDMMDLLERIKEIVAESRQFGKSRLLREYLDEIERLVDVEIRVYGRTENEHDNSRTD